MSYLLKIAIMSVSLGALLLSTGCNLGRTVSAHPLDAKLATKYAKDQDALGAVTIWGVSIKNAINDAQDDKAKRLARNKVICDLLAISDRAFSNFKNDLYANRATIDTAVGGAAIGLTGAASVTSEITTKLLAAASTALQGTNALYNEKWFADKTTPVLVQAMDAMRANKKKEIMGKFTKELDEYPLEAGLLDVEEYHDLASIVSALSYLNTLVAQVKNTPEPVISAVTAPETNLTASSATITWTTDELSDSQIQYGPTTSYGFSTTLDKSLVTSHSQNITGLQPNTLYYYNVMSKDAAGNVANSGDYKFTTKSK